MAAALLVVVVLVIAAGQLHPVAGGRIDAAPAGGRQGHGPAVDGRGARREGGVGERGSGAAMARHGGRSVYFASCVGMRSIAGEALKKGGDGRTGDKNK